MQRGRHKPSAPGAGSGVGAVAETLREQGLPAPQAAGGMTYLQARTANEVLKAQERKMRLQKLRGELVDRARATALVFHLARQERDAWAGWPARVAAMMAADLGIGGSAMQTVPETHVRQHLGELADPGSSPGLSPLMADPKAWTSVHLSIWPSTAPRTCSRLARWPHPDPDLTVSAWADRTGTEPARRQRGGPVANQPDTLSAGADGRAEPPPSGAEGGVHERLAARGFRERVLLDWLRHPSRAGADAGGAAVGGAGEAVLAAAHRSADRGEPLRAKVAPARSRDSGNTVLSKEFPAVSCA
jgi:hypothetical protein